MEAKLLLHATKILLSSNHDHQNHLKKHKSIKYCSPVSAILVGPAPAPAPAPADSSTLGANKKKNSASIVDTTYIPAQKTTVYNDNWFDKLATNHLSHNVQAAAGIRTKRRGYEGLVEAARAVHQNFDPAMQRDLVILALDRAFPRPILNLIRTLLPQSKFAREYFAAFTTLFFAWLVGPCEVQESEFNGRREKNVVHIKKCRFLEDTNCVGMCLNMCKMPCQSFIKDSLGMPVNMVPNFEDMSCEMVFGQDPPLPTNDPALRQPCFSLCKAKQRHSTKCIPNSE